MSQADSGTGLRSQSPQRCIGAHLVPFVAAFGVMSLAAACSSGGQSGTANASSGSSQPRSSAVMMVFGSTNNGPIYLSQQDGCYKSYNIKMKTVNDTKGVALANSALLGGSVDFVLDPLSSVMSIVSAGGKAKMVAQFGTGVAYQLIINPARAQALGLNPQSSSDAVLSAFKGSGLKVAVVSKTSNTKLDLAYALKPIGAVEGKDYSFVYTGSQENVVAAYNTGKADAIVGNPQLAFSVQGDAPIQIPVSQFPGVAGSNANGLITTQKLIDTDGPLVQDVVNCYVKEWNRMYSGDATSIQKQMSGDFKAGGLTDGNAVSKAYSIGVDNMKAAGTPAITQSTFDKTLALNNGTNALLSPPKAPATLKIGDVVDNSFVNKSISTQHLSLATGPTS